MLSVNRRGRGPSFSPGLIERLKRTATPLTCSSPPNSHKKSIIRDPILCQETKTGTAKSINSAHFSHSSRAAHSLLRTRTPFHARGHTQTQLQHNAIMATTTTKEQQRHAHHHHHDNSYLTSTNKNDAGVRITRLGLYSNLGMAIAKGVGGYAFNSQAMVADAWHSLTDLASDIITLATVSWSLKPPTALWPSGFGKIESLGSLGVSGMLLFGGCFMCFNSLEILYAHFFLDAAAAAEAAAHGHGHSHDHGPPSLHAIWLALGTVLLKEWLYHASKLPNSSSLTA